MGIFPVIATGLPVSISTVSKFEVTCWVFYSFSLHLMNLMDYCIQILKLPINASSSITSSAFLSLSLLLLSFSFFLSYTQLYLLLSPHFSHTRTSLQAAVFMSLCRGVEDSWSNDISRRDLWAHFPLVIPFRLTVRKRLNSKIQARSRNTVVGAGENSKCSLWLRDVQSIVGVETKLKKNLKERKFII